MGQHHLQDLVRQIQPATFSATAHGAGYRIVYAGKTAAPYRTTVFGALLRRGDERHYFVKRWLTPKEVNDWTFHWSEGTSAVGLDFEARLVIQASDDQQALRLVEALAAGAEPGETLYEMINAALHEELQRLLQECDAKTASLLDCFQRSSAGIGQSEDLNSRVSELVAEKLGVACFRVGFQLKNVPPMQVEIRRQDDSFMLADSNREHRVETSALLQLVNYQAYKKSGLVSEEDVVQTMRRSISQAVRQFLFARKYHVVMRSFKRGADSIEMQMQTCIEADAASIGYRVRTFQSFPDIAALKLLNLTRIDIEAREEKYYLSQAMSYVQMSIALNVQLKREFGDLHLLIHPDEADVLGPIAAQVRLICRDTIQQFDREQFNLYFRSEIEPVLEEAIVVKLGTFGLQATIIHLQQVATEDSHRFMALRSQTIGFRVDISPHANVGEADRVTMSGKIEVTGMPPDSWERFEAKDFGYRRDSHVLEAVLRQQAQRLGLAVSAEMPLPAKERQALAIQAELAEIRDRVVSTLTESMSKIPDLAASWRTQQGSREMLRDAQELATRAVEAEFGLTIALRSVYREDTDTEETARVRRNALHQLARQSAEIGGVESEDLRRIAGGYSVEVRSDVHDEPVKVLRSESDIELEAIPSNERLTGPAGEHEVSS